MIKFSHKRVSGLSGNEIFCLKKLGMEPGQLCLGNSVVSIGVIQGIGAKLTTLLGGEVSDLTKLVHLGRLRAYNQMWSEAHRSGGAGLTGVTFSMVNHGGNLEFITTGSTVHDGTTKVPAFSSACDAQQLFCQVDSGFRPVSFVFGNVAYSIGIGGNITGSLKRLQRGEVPEFTEIFDKTRHLALERLTLGAKNAGANAVVGIETVITPLMGTQEMMMTGTACHHPSLAHHSKDPVTSDMTSEEMWNMVEMGYLPLKLVMGVSVYSLGLAGGIRSALQSVFGGELSDMSEILHEAREEALSRIHRDAEACGADLVVGVKTRIFDLGGGLVEFMAIGTAVKKVDGVQTSSDHLPPQAIIRDRDTFVDSSYGGVLNLDPSQVRNPMDVPGRTLLLVGIVITVILSKLLNHS